MTRVVGMALGDCLPEKARRGTGSWEKESNFAEVLRAGKGFLPLMANFRRPAWLEAPSRDHQRGRRICAHFILCLLTCCLLWLMIQHS
jgi:hypothetical protein